MRLRYGTNLRHGVPFRQRLICAYPILQESLIRDTFPIWPYCEPEGSSSARTFAVAVNLEAERICSLFGRSRFGHQLQIRRTIATRTRCNPPPPVVRSLYRRTGLATKLF